jgi:predicted Zn-dependent protease
VSSLFYNLGRKLRPHVRKARWVWRSLTGDEADVIRAEQQVGHDLAVEIRRQLKPDQDERAGRLLEEVGSRLAGCVANKLRSFSFEAVQGGEPNAFALPGGFVFVTRSLVELCEWNADEIAFILGHEMGHVIRGHAMDRIISNSAIALGAKAAPVRGAVSAWLGKVGVRFLESAYSQDTELEADRLGARLVAAAGYDEQAPAAFLARLAKLKRGEGEFDLGQYFQSHPSFKVRIQAVRNMSRR